MNDAGGIRIGYGVRADVLGLLRRLEDDPRGVPVDVEARIRAVRDAVGPDVRCAAPLTPLTLVYALAMLPLHFALVLTGGDFDGLLAWWKRGGGRR